MLFKRGSTISAAEGGCQAEVGGTPFAFPPSPIPSMTCLLVWVVVACSMASAGFAACMGGTSIVSIVFTTVPYVSLCLILMCASIASPETVLQAAEIGIGMLADREHYDQLMSYSCTIRT